MFCILLEVAKHFSYFFISAFMLLVGRQKRHPSCKNMLHQFQQALPCVLGLTGIICR